MHHHVSGKTTWCGTGREVTGVEIRDMLVRQVEPVQERGWSWGGGEWTSYWADQGFPGRKEGKVGERPPAGIGSSILGEAGLLGTRPGNAPRRGSIHNPHLALKLKFPINK